MSKYFKYAFGEIILVVIGILIALQVNNWNQKRLDRNFEITMLKEVKNGLESDLLTYSMIKERAKIKENAIQDLLKMIASNMNYPDSTLIKTYYTMRFGFLFKYNKGAYKAISSVGLDKISNDSLRNVLAEIYEHQYPRLEQFFSNEWYMNDKTKRLKLDDALFKVNMIKNSDSSLNITYIPINNKMFLKQPELLERVKIEQDILSETKRNLNYWKYVIDTCLEAVNKELEGEN